MKPNIRRIWRFFLFFFWWVSKILHRWVVSFPWAEPIKPYYNFFFFLTPGDWKPSKPLHFLFFKKLIRFLAKISPVKQTLLGTQGIAACACVSSSSLSLSLSSSLPRHRQPFKSPFCSISLERNSDSAIHFFAFSGAHKCCILFAEGLVRSKSEVHIIDHHNNKKVCFFSRARRERRCSRFWVCWLFFSSFFSAHKCCDSGCRRIGEIEVGRRNYWSSQIERTLFIYFLLWSRRNKGKREGFSLRLLAFLAFCSAHNCHVSVCVRIGEIEVGRRNCWSS